MNPIPDCDLCGQTPHGPRFDGAEFKIEGMVCRQCRKELVDERAWARYRKLTATPYHGPLGSDGKLYAGKHSYQLMVLDREFKAEDLPLRNQCQKIVAKTSRRERRAS